jgi:hypothetical protein
MDIVLFMGLKTMYWLTEKQTVAWCDTSPATARQTGLMVNFLLFDQHLPFLRIKLSRRRGCDSIINKLHSHIQYKCSCAKYGYKLF